MVSRIKEHILDGKGKEIYVLIVITTTIIFKIAINMNSNSLEHVYRKINSNQ